MKWIKRQPCCCQEYYFTGKWNIHQIIIRWLHCCLIIIHNIWNQFHYITKTFRLALPDKVMHRTWCYLMARPAYISMALGNTVKSTANALELPQTCAKPLIQPTLESSNITQVHYGHQSICFLPYSYMVYKKSVWLLGGPGWVGDYDFL